MLSYIATQCPKVQFQTRSPVHVDDTSKYSNTAAHSPVEFVSRELVSKWKPFQTQTESHAKSQHSAEHDDVEMN